MVRVVVPGKELSCFCTSHLSLQLTARQLDQYVSVQPHLSASVLPSWPIDKEQQMSELSSYSWQRQEQGQIMKGKNNYELKGRGDVVQEPLWSDALLMYLQSVLAEIVHSYSASSGMMTTLVLILDKSSNDTYGNGTSETRYCSSVWAPSGSWCGSAVDLFSGWSVFDFSDRPQWECDAVAISFVSQALKWRRAVWCRWIIHETFDWRFAFEPLFFK